VETIRAKPKYLQLRERLLADISGGIYGEGAALPAIKQIMASHDVALGTAIRAIEMLANEGVLERKAGKGVFVRRQPSVPRGLAISLFEISRYIWDDVSSASPLLSGCHVVPLAKPPLETDIVGVTSTWATDLIHRRQILPLNRFLESDPLAAALLDRNCRVFHRGDTLYALPVYHAPLRLQVNLDIFAGAGVEPPGELAGLEQLERIAARLRERGVAQPLVLDSRFSTLAPFLCDRPEDLVEPGGKRPILDTPRARSGLDSLRRLCAASGVFPRRQRELLDDFLAGRTAMTFWGPPCASGNPGFRRADLPLPAPVQRPVVFAEGLAISAVCRQPEHAWRVIREFAVERAPQRLIDRGIPFPCGAQSALEFLARYPDAMRAYCSLKQPFAAHLAITRERQDIIRSALGEWWRPETDLAAALRHAQSVIDAVLEAEAAAEQREPGG